MRTASSCSSSAPPRAAQRPRRSSVRACAATAEHPGGVEAAKAALLRLVQGSGRGMSATRQQRVAVQEAALRVEAFGRTLDQEQLAGDWTLLYTTAADVLVLLEAAQRSFGLLYVRAINQNFDAYGRVENVINVAGPLGEAVLRVRARYERAGDRSISLRFEEAGVNGVVPAPALETLLAPALLPRTAPQMLLLQSIRALNLFIPLPGVGRDVDGGADGMLGAANAGAYLLSFCDESMLVGRALTGGGLFIFSRESAPPSPKAVAEAWEAAPMPAAESV